MKGLGMGCRGIDPVRRFWSKVEHGNVTECWLWAGNRNNKGYGTMGLLGRPVLAHRIAFRLASGSIPDGLCVLHSCDTPLCCNPGHLRLGTQADNLADMTAKGRRASLSRPGTANPHRAALNEDVVVVARRLFRRGWTGKNIATLFQANLHTINNAIHGIKWKHVKEEAYGYSN